MWRPYSPIVSDLPCHWVLSMFVGDVGRRGATSSHVKNLTAQTWRSTHGWSFSSKCGFDRLALLVHRGAVYRSTGVYVVYWLKCLDAVGQASGKAYGFWNTMLPWSPKIFVDSFENHWLIPMNLKNYKVMLPWPVWNVFFLWLWTLT